MSCDATVTERRTGPPAAGRPAGCGPGGLRARGRGRGRGKQKQGGGDVPHESRCVCDATTSTFTILRRRRWDIYNMAAGPGSDGTAHAGVMADNRTHLWRQRPRTENSSKRAETSDFNFLSYFCPVGPQTGDVTSWRTYRYKIYMFYKHGYKMEAAMTSWLL